MMSRGEKKGSLFGRILAYMLVFQGLWFSAVVSAETVIINKPLSENDVRYQYTQDLLKLILRQADTRYEVKQAAKAMSRDRTFRALKKGERIHVMAEAPKPEWMRELIPVEMPIRKGIQGYRVFLTKEKHQARLAAVQSLSDLTALPTGSGQQWSTRSVMEDAGFNVVTSTNYDALFGMLENERFITFGRGINEAFREVAVYRKRYPDLIVDASLILYIPLPTYFFVTPTKPELALHIEKGFRKIMADGTFDAFFYRYHCDDLRSLNLKHRKMFSIPNTNLGTAFKPMPKELWLDRDKLPELCQN